MKLKKLTNGTLLKRNGRGMRWNIIEIESNMIKVRMRKIMVGGVMEECIEIDTVKILCLILIRKRSLIFRYCIVLLARYNRSKINFDKIKNEFLVRDISNSENVQFSLENSRSYLFENNFFFLPLFFFLE